MPPPIPVPSVTQMKCRVPRPAAIFVPPMSTPTALATVLASYGNTLDARGSRTLLHRTEQVGQSVDQCAQREDDLLAGTQDVLGRLGPDALHRHRGRADRT